MNNNLLFSLDIGTRSVIGIVAEQDGNTIKVIATERKEHNTRAMLDGQIHDVPEVALVLQEVKNALEKKTGPLTKAAVAAAGRALYTVTADASIAVTGILSEDDERALDFSAIQAAQKKLASSNLVDDPTMYYCVGYSTVKYTLDGTQLKTLVGQRGKQSSATVISTFLPRQVIDSMQSALADANLEMSSLTLEPIAAINVLIPLTMRHLNLVLVDIGAGTSDVAITKNGSVVGYGMVPLAGDEITEAISQKYLLDFNVAEKVKRQISATTKNRKISFNDILGMEHRLTAKELLNTVMPNINDLGQAIAKQILALNTTAPQAVLLVGGGSLTPCLPEVIAKVLDIPPARVAVRTPDSAENIIGIPNVLKAPDAVTPLGILKAATSNTLNFITVTVNDNELRLFNISKLTVADALLAAGINIKDLGGKPGLGITITVNDKNEFIPGTMGKVAQIKLNGESSTLTNSIKHGDNIIVKPGTNGSTPNLYLKDITPALTDYEIFINGSKFIVRPVRLINNEPATPNTKLRDRDIVVWREIKNLGEVLRLAGYIPTPHKYKYSLNGAANHYSSSPTILINDKPAPLSTTLEANDKISFTQPHRPTIGEVIGIDTLVHTATFQCNNEPCQVDTAKIMLTVDNITAKLHDKLKDGCCINYTVDEKTVLIVSDVLLAANYQPPAPDTQVSFEIRVNNNPAEFTSRVNPGDRVDIILTPLTTTYS